MSDTKARIVLTAADETRSAFDSASSWLVVPS